MAFNHKELKRVLLLVVPPTSMTISVVIGRDILRQFFEKNLLNEVENVVENC